MLIATSAASAATANAATLYWAGDVSDTVGTQTYFYWDRGVNGNTGDTVNSNWSTSSSSNVDALVAPASTDDIKFNNSSTTTVTSEIMQPTGSVSIRSLEILANAGPVSINCTSTSQFFNISGGITVGAGAGQLNIDVRTTYAANQTWTNNSSNAVKLSSLENNGARITLSAGTFEFGTTVVVKGDGTSVTNNGLLTGTGVWSIQSGATLTRSGNGAYNGSGSIISMDGGTLSGGGAAISLSWLEGNSGTINNFGATGGALTFWGGGTGVHTLGFALPNTIGDLVLFMHNGAGGTLVLTGQNLNTGQTKIASDTSGVSATLQLAPPDVGANGDNRLNPNTVVVMGTTNVPNSATAKLILGNGNGAVNQTIAGLTNNTTNVAGKTMDSIIIGGASAFSTLTVNPTLSTDYVFSGKIGGTGTFENNINLVKSGAKKLTLSGINTYAGNTTVNAGTLALADNAGLRFVIGANGVNNGISGAGTLTLDGDFTFDLTGASQTLGSSWNIVANNTLAETYGATFTVVGFTEQSSTLWTQAINGSVQYAFDESTGTLSVADVPEPAAMGLLVLALPMLSRKRRTDRRVG